MNITNLKNAKRMIVIAFVALFMLISGISLNSLLSNNSNNGVKADGYYSDFWRDSDFEFIDYATIPTNYITFKEYKNIISGLNDSEINNYSVVIEDGMDLYDLSHNSRFDGTIELYQKYLKSHYILGDDIDYDTTAGNGYLFSPLGSDAYPFTGTIDGQGFEISNLFFKPIENENDYNAYYNFQYYSFISVLGDTQTNNAYIKNIRFNNPIIMQSQVLGQLRYASYVVGLNKGLVENVVVNDDRGDASGISAEGGFGISGIVTHNIGYFKNSYIVANRVVSTAVTSNLGVNPVLYSNTLTINNSSYSGIIENVYYDSTKYTGNISINQGITSSTPGSNILILGLSTSAFQTSSFAATGFYMNSDYPAGVVTNTYPDLQGLHAVLYGTLTYYLISNGSDLVVMSDLINKYAYFRSQNFALYDCIDMRSVSVNAYVPPSVAFNGTFTSIDNPENCDHTLLGNNEYHAIINLTIKSGSIIDNKHVYGLFGVLNGSVKNINIVNAKIMLEDVESFSSSETAEYDVGIIAGLTRSNAVINNVYINGDIFDQTLSNNHVYNIGKVNIGGVVGRGSGSITNVTISGAINGIKIDYSATSLFGGSSFGGVIGLAEDTALTNLASNMIVKPISYNNSVDVNLVTYVGGIVGSGRLNALKEVVNYGAIYATRDTSYQGTIYLGGIIGYSTGVNYSVEKVVNYGDIYFNHQGSIKARIAGYGTINSNSQEIIYGVGTSFDIYTNSYSSFPTADGGALQTSDVKMTHGIIADATDIVINGLHVENKQGTSSTSVDLTIIGTFASNFIFENEVGKSAVLNKSYSTLNVDFITTNSLTMIDTFISGNSYGKNINYNGLRNEGNLNINIAHQTTQYFRQTSTKFKELVVVGLLEEISQDKIAENLYNGGDITIRTTHSTGTVKYNVFVSGISYKNLNTDLFTEAGVSNTSLVVDSSFTGSINNALNYGNIDVEMNVYGQSRIGGICVFNSSLISNAFNIGDIYNKNYVYDPPTSSTITSPNDSYNNGEFEVETGGIVFLMSSAYAQIKDTINYGKIYSIATSTYGWVNSSGIAVRNDKIIDGTDYGSLSTSERVAHLSKIQFSANYGDIVAWNNYSSTLNSTAETRAKASGILALGVLSVVNTVNYGNIFSKSTASGIYGQVFLSKFNIEAQSVDPATGLITGQVYIANSMNYGKIRLLNSTANLNNSTYETVSSYLSDDLDDSSGNVRIPSTSYQFGATIANLADSNSRAANIIISYMLNFDSNINMLGKSNITTDDPALTQYMFSVKPDDTSPAPLGGVNYRAMNTTLGSGIFAVDFPLRTISSNFTYITEYYIQDYIQFIPYTKANSNATGEDNNTLLKKIGFEDLAVSLGLVTDAQKDTIGIYALSSSSGIQQGIFLPDNISWDGLDPVENGTSQTSWRSSISSGGNGLDDVFIIELKQLKKSISTAIFDVVLEKIDSQGNVVDGQTLRDPTIDLVNNVITFYVADNQDEAFADGCTSAGCGINNQTETLNVPTVVQNSNQYVSVSASVDTLGELWNYINSSLSSGKNLKTITVYLNGVAYTFDSNTISSASSQSSVRTYVANTALTSTVPIGDYDSNGNLIADGKYYAGNYNATFASQYVSSYTVYYTTKTVGGVTYYVPTGRTRRTTTIVNTSNSYSVNSPYNRVTKVYNGSSYTAYEYAGPRTDSYIKYDYTYEDTINTTTVVIPSENARYQIRVGSEVLAYGASIVDGSNVVTEVPRLYNSYVEYEDYQNGSVQIAAEDTTVVGTYIIKIVRTAPRGISVTSIDVDDAYSSYTTASNGMEVSVINSLDNKIKVSMNSINMADQTNILPLIDIYYMASGESTYSLMGETQSKQINGIVQTITNYYLSGGIVNNSNAFNQETGEVGTGSVDFTLELSTFTKGGSYKIVINLSNSSIMEIYFDKNLSSEALITKIVYSQQEQLINGTTITTEIPYGKFYDEILNPSEYTMNFNNIQSISNVEYDEILDSNKPTYLDSLEISQYATYSVTGFDIEIFNEYYHRYTITYTVIAEDGFSSSEYQHIIEEKVNSTSIDTIYKDSSTMEKYYDSGNLITSFGREEEPVYSIVYNLDDFYLPSGNSYLSLIYEENANYSVQTVLGQGYNVSLYLALNPGTYTFGMSYINSGINVNSYTLSWNMPLESISIIKNKNTNSYLYNITFVTDTIFAGLNTIMDNTELTVTHYNELLQDPIARDIVVLPSKIYYNGYQSIDGKFYVVVQVQKTNISNYMPVFVLPVGAKIYRIDPTIEGSDQRVRDENSELDGTPSSDTLRTDFDITADEVQFSFITYRVYAEGYDENPTLYTDYLVAVQDISYNVKIDVSVQIDPNMSSEARLELLDMAKNRVFITLNNYLINTDGTFSHDEEDIISSMSLFSFYHSSEDLFNNTIFTNNSAGYYQFYIDLPSGYNFTYSCTKLDPAVMTDVGFEVPVKIVPTKYEITITITYDSNYQKDWGLNNIVDINDALNEIN